MNITLTVPNVTSVTLAINISSGSITHGYNSIVESKIFSLLMFYFIAEVMHA